MNLLHLLQRLSVASENIPNFGFDPRIVVTGFPLTGKTYMALALKQWFVETKGIPPELIRTLCHYAARRNIYDSVANMQDFSSRWDTAIDSMMKQAGADNIHPVLTIVEDWHTTGAQFVVLPAGQAPVPQSDREWYINRPIKKPGMYVTILPTKADYMLRRAFLLGEGLHPSMVQFLANVGPISGISDKLGSYFINDDWYNSPKDMFPIFEEKILPFFYNLEMSLLPEQNASLN